MKQNKNLKTLKVHKNSSLPYSEIFDSGEKDGDVEILMGEDIDLENAIIEKVFYF